MWEWDSWEHLDPAEYPIASVQSKRSEWTHINSVAELPDGDLVLSCRNVSMVLRLQRSSGRIVWRVGPPLVAGQHAAEPLPNGNMLIFDNGPDRIDEPFPFSRIIELNPATLEILWKYQEPIVDNFFSARLSNAQRLPNGNTLIIEGLFGRMFEVTAGGEVVWEYVNPHFGPADRPPEAQNNSVFRAYRYTPEEVARARAR